MLQENGYTDLADCLNRTQKRYEQGIYKIANMQLCDHEWSEPTIKDAPFFRMRWMEKLSDAEKLDVWRNMYCNCKKCGLRYDYAGTDLDKARDIYEKRFYIDPHFTAYSFYDSITEQHDKQEEKIYILEAMETAYSRKN